MAILKNFTLGSLLNHSWEKKIKQTILTQQEMAQSLPRREVKIKQIFINTAQKDYFFILTTWEGTSPQITTGWDLLSGPVFKADVVKGARAEVKGGGGVEGTSLWWHQQ